MRNMNCRNVRREIEGAGADELSSAVSAHVAGCTECATLSRQQSNLHAIISGLGTVAAPGDFDFRLRARLAGEKPGTRPWSFLSLSFGLRSGALAMALLMIGALILFVSYRTTPIEQPLASQPSVTHPSEAGNVATNDGNATPHVAVTPKESQPDAVEVSSGLGEKESHRRIVRPQVAVVRGNRVGTREMSSTSAAVLSRDGRLDEAYPTAAFPINASYQSLKVSVDDGRGSSRTISLPTVSFGSQRALSQSTTPLVASARGVW